MVWIGTDDEKLQRELEAANRTAPIMVSMRVPDKEKVKQDVAIIDESKSIEELAKDVSPKAIKALLDVAINGKSESARVAAANALLDRGVGKPKANLEISGQLTLAQIVEQSYLHTIDVTPEEVK